MQAAACQFQGNDFHFAVDVEMAVYMQKHSGSGLFILKTHVYKFKTSFSV